MQYNTILSYHDLPADSLMGSRTAFGGESMNKCSGFVAERVD